MAKIAFLLLCHKDPAAVIRQAQSLTSVGDGVAIHFDARAPAADYRQIRAALADDPNVTFTRRRLRCGWGEWALVAATLAAAEAALTAFPRAGHLYLISGDCMAIKPAAHLQARLAAADRDYIETVDYFTSGWIKTGWREERLVYRHWFNERTQRRRFYAMFEIQHRLGLRRPLPADLEMRIGSQWWCLRRATVERVLAFLRARPDIRRFFRTTWIPDETLFQTLVPHLVPEGEIESRSPTFLMFSDYGMPVSFHDDHYDLLLRQSQFFARKISPEADELKRRLAALYAAEGAEVTAADEGPALYRFLTGAGRRGRRFAPRAWEAGATLGRDRTLLVLVCKDWERGRALAARIGAATDGLPCLGYLFNEEEAGLPDLGGLQSSVAKRHRHRRALMRMLYEHYGSDRLLICLDPSNLDLLEDFRRDRAGLRLLEIGTDLSGDFLRAHATRSGLVGPGTPEADAARLLPTLGASILRESDRLRDAGFEQHARLSPGAPPEAEAATLAEFLEIGAAAARTIAAPDSTPDETSR